MCAKDKGKQVDQDPKDLISFRNEPQGQGKTVQELSFELHRLEKGSSWLLCKVSMPVGEL